ncbi:MAG: type II toxin-antitoxin system VapC family toxin, partial [Methylococcaceae bacterium]|nr:type II toxin-antitoxin system VapC family toxin [Methylococcaceae bacterium]
MRLLLDTHLVLWWQANHPRLPDVVRDLVCNQAEAVFISRASLWEMAIKVSLNRL